MKKLAIFGILAVAIAMFFLFFPATSPSVTESAAIPTTAQSSISDGAATQTPSAKAKDWHSDLKQRCSSNNASHARETAVVARVFEQSVLTGPFSGYNTDAAGVVTAGRLRGATIDQLLPLAEANDSEAQLVYGLHQLRAQAIQWTNGISDKQWTDMEQAEQWVHKAYVNTQNPDLIYLLHDAYRYAMQTAWINIDKVGHAQWQKVQARFLAYERLMQQQGSDRQYLQIQLDRLNDQHINSANGLTMPRQISDEAQTAADTAQLADHLHLNPDTSLSETRQLLQHWVDHNANDMATALACVATTS